MIPRCAGWWNELRKFAKLINNISLTKMLRLEVSLNLAKHSSERLKIKTAAEE
ncbi:MAG: hypothetical protein ACTS6G_02775 [Candidatus Hodgkinia cicadicola]